MLNILPFVVAVCYWKETRRYMNSSLQCLSHANIPGALLARRTLDINTTNPLGHQVALHK
jgi:ubiquitin C-terminal hydrolase